MYTTKGGKQNKQKPDHNPRKMDTNIRPSKKPNHKPTQLGTKNPN